MKNSLWYGPIPFTIYNFVNKKYYENRGINDLGFTRTGTLDGDKNFDSSPEKTSRFNSAKVQEIKDRLSM